MTDKSPPPPRSETAPTTAKPPRTLSYGQANPKQGAGGRRASPPKDD